jgi:hypothetical protein
MQACERLVNRQKPLIEANRSAVALQKLERDLVSSALLTLYPSGVIYQDSTHLLRGHRKKMRAIVPIRLLRAAA